MKEFLLSTATCLFCQKWSGFLQQITKNLLGTSSPRRAMLLKGNLFSLFCFVRKTTTMGLPAGQKSQKIKKLRMAVYSAQLHNRHISNSTWEESWHIWTMVKTSYILWNKNEWNFWLDTYLQIRKLCYSK